MCRRTPFGKEGRMDYVLELSNIYKYYGSLAANKDVSLKVKKGSVHAIVGENGAGKSTLMNVIAGVISPDSGTIKLNGKDQVFRNANDANRAGIGMVQQEFMLFDRLSVLDNIIMGYEGVEKGCFINRKACEAKIKEICEEYGFHFELNALVRDLPIAVQQQVEIVKVLYRKADIIILDEPTAVLPYQEVQGLFKAIRYLVSQGKTVLFITHKLKEVLEISDVVTVMRNGQISGEINTKDATETLLTNMMVGREVMLTIDKKITDHKKDVLKVNGLNVRDDRQILRVKNASFTLKEGEILGIVGVSGNGQNELVEAITGLRSWENGEVLLDDEPLTCGSIRNRRLHQIGYVPQDRIRYGSSRDSSLVENCIMGYHLQHLRKKKFLMDYNAAASFTKDIVSNYKVKAGSIQDRAGSLSGGNLQKLIVGREFSQNNKVLVIEDPTRGIDVGAIEFIWHEIQKQVEEEGVSVILITYDLNEAMTLSDRILVMFDGNFNHEFAGPDYDEKEIGLYMMGGGSNEKDA